MKNEQQIREEWTAFFKRTSKKHRDYYRAVLEGLMGARLDIHTAGENRPFWRPKTTGIILRASISQFVRDNMENYNKHNRNQYSFYYYGNNRKGIDRVAEIVGFQKVEKKYPKEYDFEKIKEYKHSPVKYRYVFKKRWWRWLFG